VNNCICLLFLLLFILLVMNIIFGSTITFDLRGYNCRVVALVSFALVPIHNNLVAASQ